MRASLLQEASTLLKIPVAALEEDLEKGMRDEGRGSPKPETRNPKPGTRNEKPEAPEDAAAPENNPPPPTEMALMEFLFGNGPDGRLADMLETYAPDELFANDLTRAFIRAYACETRGEPEALANLGKDLPAAEALRLEEVFLAKERAALSELEPARILEDFLRRLWSEAVRRRLGKLPVRGDAELERRRLELSVRMRKFKSSPWKVASSLMLSELLK